MNKSDYHRSVTPLSVYENNYHKIMRLFPVIREQDDFAKAFNKRKYCLSSGLCLQIIEHFRYTSLIHLSQDLVENSKMLHIQLELRLSHDVRVAEVSSFQGRAIRQKRFTYPNAVMQRIDEKKQMNLHVKMLLDQAFCCIADKVV